MGKLDNRVAIVTGGGTGIGRATAIEFAKAGADLVITSRNMGNLLKVAGEIKALGRDCLAVVTDVSKVEQIHSMVQQTIDSFRRIDILVNNAGITQRNALLKTTEQDWDHVMAVNLKGTFFCIQAVAKYMMEQKYGKIINISSLAGQGMAGIGSGAFRERFVYAASKAGVDNLTKSCAVELGPYRINVNAIAPGLIETGIFRTGRTEQEVEQFLEYGRKAAVLCRMGTPQDIANMALFLASDDSYFITGQIITIDGGRADMLS